MKLIYVIIFIVLNIFSKIIYAQEIVVVNIQSLIDNNDIYIDTLKKIDQNQKKYLEKFKKKEIELTKISNNIDESKLILNDSEINLQIENYNNELSNFTTLLDEFNFHYQNQIISIREAVYNEIILLLENYAISYNIDLILDSTAYLIASNSMDITEVINEELKKINLKLEFEDFETN